MANCKACGAQIFWRKNITTGKSIPIDQAPSRDRGNILLATPETCRILKEVEAAPARASGSKLYVSHFGSCPDAENFRRAKSLAGKG